MTQALKNRSAEATQGKNQELTLTNNFEGVVLKKTNSGLTVDVSALNGVDLTVITSGGVLQFKANPAPTIELKAPAAEQVNAPAIITASKVTPASFIPNGAIIRAGEIELWKISQYLANLPKDAKAQLLVAPQDLAKIDNQGLGTWRNSVKRIRQIEGYHGLDGMRIFDRPETAPSVTYEQDWANQIRTAFDQARSTGQPVTTGLFLGTKEIVHGKKIGESRVRVPTNLYSLRDAIGKQGDAFITRSASDDAPWQWSATEDPDYPSRSGVYGVDFTDGDDSRVHKDDVSLFSRPVALELQP